MTLGDNKFSKKKVAVAATFILAFAACGPVVGCSSEPETVTPTEDTGSPDTGSDTGTVTETGIIDSGTPDTEMDTKVIPTDPTATPQFTPPSGTVDTKPINVTITSATAGAVIYYTTDGTTPNTSSAKYSAPISVTAKMTTIKAMALAPDKLQSEIATATYTVNTPPGTVEAVTFSPIGGTYTNDQSVALASATPAATICYTTDGTTAPTCDGATGTCTGSSATYSASAPVDIKTTGKKISAIACKAGNTNSAVTSATYVLNAAPAVFAPVEGAYDAPGVLLTATLATAGATVRYTTNGTSPDCTAIGSTFDFSGVSVPFNTQFKAITCKTGYNPSAVQTLNYTVRTRAVTSSRASGDINNTTPVTLTQPSETTTGLTGVICYSVSATNPTCTGGLTPTCTAGTLYTAAISVTGDTTLKVVACDSNRTPGPMSTYTYTARIAGPTFVPPSGSKLTEVAVAGGAIVNTTTAPADLTMRYQADPAGAAPTCTTGTASTCVAAAAGRTGSDCPIPTTDIQADKAVRVILCKTGYASTTGSVTYASPTALGAPVISPAAGSGIFQNRTVLTMTPAAGSPAGTWVCYVGSITGIPADSAVACGPAAAPGGAPASPTCASGTRFVPYTASTAEADKVVTNFQGTNVKAIACPAFTTSSPSGVASELGYSHKTANPTLNPAGGSVGAGSSIVVSSATLVGGVHAGALSFHYRASATGTPPVDPTCATSVGGGGAGTCDGTNTSTEGCVVGAANTAVTATEASLPPSVTNVSSPLTVKVIACKAGYLASDVTTATYAPKVADPVITPAVGAGSTRTNFLDAGANITSASGTGTKLCFTWDGGEPSCDASLICGTTGATTSLGQQTMTSGSPSGNVASSVFGTEAVPISGKIVKAIACRTGLPNSAVVAQTYNFATSAVAFKTPAAYDATVNYTSGNQVLSGTVIYAATATPSTAAAPKPVTDTSAWTPVKSASITFGLSNPTNGGSTESGSDTNSLSHYCYRIDGIAPTFEPVVAGGNQDPCAKAVAAATAITCRTGTTPLDGVPPDTTLTNVSRSISIVATACRKGFASTTTTQNYTFAPYRHTINMATGTNDFTGAESLNSTTASTGYVTYDDTNLYVGFFGPQVASSSTDSLSIYLRAPGVSTATQAISGWADSPGMEQNYHLRWQASTGTLGLKFWNGTVWLDVATTGITAARSGASPSDSFVKLKIPLSTIGVTTTTQFSFFGAIHETSGGDNSAFPDADEVFTARNWLAVDMASALNPNDSTKLRP